MNYSNHIYDNLNDAQKEHIIRDLYQQSNYSFGDIAERLQTYPNKIRRDAKKFNIPIRSKSEAQKNALNTGKHKHPTKGVARPEEIKQKIGLGVLNAWEKLDDIEIESRKSKAKANWDKLDDNTKDSMHRSAMQAVRHSSKVGSKLEKFLLEQLMKQGYSVEFHKEQTLTNTKLQIDLFLPQLNIAIEVDGPSHFKPVWGEETLNRNQKYDKKKSGLIVGKGWHLIRIKQTKDFSVARANLIYNDLRSAIQDCQKSDIQKTITIED